MKVDNTVAYSEKYLRKVENFKVTEEDYKLDFSFPLRELKDRVDYSSLETITIDAPNSRDLDDALSCYQLDNGDYCVGVHITDASFYVPFDSALDKKAREQTSSIYLPTETIPMLPEVLSSGRCSLVEGKERLCLSLTFTISPSGEVQSYEMERTVICSSKKLSYEEAQEIIDADTQDSEKKYAQVVLQLHHLANTLRENREKRCPLSLDGKKYEPVYDDEKLIEFKETTRETSRALVQEFMILANVYCARWLTKYNSRGVILRSQGDSADIAEFQKQCRKGLRLPVDFSSKEKAIKSLEIIKKKRGEAVLSAVLQLWGKQRAGSKFVVSDREEEYKHYSLNEDAYCNFTSPLRRYGDLMTHRQVVETLECGSHSFSTTTMNNIVDHLNSQSRKIGSLVREVSRLYFAEYLQENPQKATHAVVTHIKECYYTIWIPLFGLSQSVKLTKAKQEEMGNLGLLSRCRAKVRANKNKDITKPFIFLCK